MRVSLAQSFQLTSVTVLAVSLFGTAACSSDDTNEPAPVATSIVATAGSSGQTGTVGTVLALPISVNVKDQNGDDMSGAVVSWTVLTGGGSVANATSTTVATGNAVNAWALGPAPGENTLKAALASGASVTLTATGVIGPLNTLTVVSGTPQTVPAGMPSAPMVVKATDVLNNLIPGLVITWTTNTGILSATTTTTGADGTTSVTLTASNTFNVVTATSGTKTVNFNITSN